MTLKAAHSPKDALDNIIDLTKQETEVLDEMRRLEDRRDELRREMVHNLIESGMIHCLTINRSMLRREMRFKKGF